MLKEQKACRIQNYNYPQKRAYLVTICAKGRKCIFGNINDGEMNLTPAGKIISGQWRNLPYAFVDIEMDEFVVMPNHFHGIIVVGGEAGKSRPNSGRKSMAIFREFAEDDQRLREIIRTFKSLSTNEYNLFLKNNNWPANKLHLWHPDNRKNVIPDQAGLNSIRDYIINNPSSWKADEYYFANANEKIKAAAKNSFLLTPRKKL